MNPHLYFKIKYDTKLFRASTHSCFFLILFIILFYCLSNIRELKKNPHICTAASRQLLVTV